LKGSLRVRVAKVKPAHVTLFGFGMGRSIRAGAAHPERAVKR
jgi:hypothetical protein